MCMWGVTWERDRGLCPVMKGIRKIACSGAGLETLGTIRNEAVIICSVWFIVSHAGHLV